VPKIVTLVPVGGALVFVKLNVADEDDPVDRLPHGVAAGRPIGGRDRRCGNPGCVRDRRRCITAPEYCAGSRRRRRKCHGHTRKRIRCAIRHLACSALANDVFTVVLCGVPDTTDIDCVDEDVDGTKTTSAQ
jgi:hypothetical protein